MRMILAAGGTGGGIFPAVAVARAVRTMRPAAEILFVGASGGMECRLVPVAGFPLEVMPVRGWKGKGLSGRLASAARLPGAFLASRKILSRFSPDVVFGSGGYAAGPFVMAAALSGRRSAVLEPNAVPGLTNRILCRFVDRAFLAFSQAASHLPSNKCSFTGNPIREEILSVPPPDFSLDTITVLVFGGSQGADRLNRAVPEMLSHLPRSPSFKFIHQAGSKDVEAVRAAYAASGGDADVRPFIEDMADAFRLSHIVIARAGSSVLEIAACGRPSILVPYPHAADDHQRANAYPFVEAGAAVCIEDSACDGASLGSILRDICADRSRLANMSRAALSFRRERAASDVACALCELAAEGRRK